MPLLVDLDGEVLEAATANVWILEHDTATPPLDGRLPGSVRAAALLPARGTRARRRRSARRPGGGRRGLVVLLGQEISSRRSPEAGRHSASVLGLWPRWPRCRPRPTRTRIRSAERASGLAARRADRRLHDGRLGSPAARRGGAGGGPRARSAAAAAGWSLRLTRTSAAAAAAAASARTTPVRASPRTAGSAAPVTRPPSSATSAAVSAMSSGPRLASSSASAIRPGRAGSLAGRRRAPRNRAYADARPRPARARAGLSSTVRSSSPSVRSPPSPRRARCVPPAPPARRPGAHVSAAADPPPEPGLAEPNSSRSAASGRISQTGHRRRC